MNTIQPLKEYCPRTLMFALLATIVSPILAQALCAAEFTKTRLIVMADMGNEPDEEQQMAHLLLCSDRSDVDGRYRDSRPLP